MSDSISKQDETKIDNENQQQEEEGYVPRKAYEGVSNDMHKFKSKAKEAEARATELEMRLKAIEEEKMQELNQWEELAKKRAEELEAVKTEVSQKEQRYIQAAKKARLRSELGNIRDEYIALANLDAIQLNDDGSINEQSLHQVANDFREKHSVLIPKSTESSSTSVPAKNEEPNLNELSEDELKRKLSSMSYEEKLHFMKSLQGE